MTYWHPPGISLILRACCCTRRHCVPGAAPGKSIGEILVKRIFRFRIRTLLAVTAGIACVLWLIAWTARNEFGWNPGAIALWAIGTFAGMYACRQPTRSTLLGSLLGGWFVVVAFSAWWVLDRGGPIHHGLYIGLIKIFLACSTLGSSILAVVVGVLREGITISRKKDKE
jgi:hypothetical protein